MSEYNAKNSFIDNINDAYNRNPQQLVTAVMELLYELNLNQQVLFDATEQISKAVIYYMAEQAAIQSMPSLAEQRKLNKSLLKNIEKITSALSQPDFEILIARLSLDFEQDTDDNTDQLKGFNNKAVFSASLNTLLEPLDKLRLACERFENHHYPRLKNRPKLQAKGIGTIAPKQRLCMMVAQIMENTLQIKPTIYLSDEYDSHGLFSQILITCFTSADESVPKDLKRHMIKAVNESRNIFSNK